MNILKKDKLANPRTNSKAKTLPFTTEINVYSDKLKEDSKNVEEPFKQVNIGNISFFM